MHVHGALALIFFAFLVYALLARRIEASILSGPMLFTALGFALAQSGVTLLTPADWSVTEALATGTLAIILFRDAANIRISTTVAERATALLTARLLVIGIPLAMLAGTAAGLGILPGFTPLEAFVLAIVLTPTDAALAQPVFGNRAIPEVEREALDAESGLNDGLCLPILLVALAVASSEAGRGIYHHTTLFAEQVLLGPLAGALVGLVGAWATAAASARGLSYPAGRTPIMVVLAGLAYVGAELVGGNGFLAAFCAGLAFGLRLPRKTVREASNFAVTEGTILVNITFLIFGAAILPHARDVPLGASLVYALLSLTVVRLVSVLAATAGTRLAWKSRLFLGWFGPRGVASVLYLILVVDRSGFEHARAVTDVAVTTILLSVILHGASAPFAARVFFPQRPAARE